jgi:outer membrane receptor protein involved in Fe transport
VGEGVLSADFSKGSAEASTTRSFPVIETTDFDQTELNVRYAREWGDHTVVLGAGARRDDLSVSIVAQPANTDNSHVLLQDEWRFASDWKLLAGLRWDDFSTFGSVATPRLSVSYAPGPWTWRVGYGEAYRAPSPLEQQARFLRGRFLILGDAAIQPEENKAWELATNYRNERVQAEWVLFNSDVTNLIQSVQRPALPGDPPGVTTRSVYANVGKARIKGSELSASWKLDPAWSLIGGWDLLSAKDGLTGARLTQRARHTFRVGSRYEQGAWRVDVQGRYLKDYFASVNVVPPAATPAPTSTNFGTLDVKLAYRFNKTWSAALGVDNLTDRRQPANYSATGSVQDPPGRFFYLQAKAQF